MRHPIQGSARTLLLFALALAAAVVVGSMALMTIQKNGPAPSSGGSADEKSEDDEEEDSPLGGGKAGPQRPRRTNATSGEEGDDIELRIPNGDDGNFPIDEKSMRLELDGRHWEALLHQIESYDADGKPFPPEMLKDLLEMLSHDDLALDAVRALGLVKKDETVGRALVALALSPDASIEARQAALDALSKNGQKVALESLQTMVGDASSDARLVRHAIPALAAIGGPEAASTIVGLLRQHADPGDDLHGALVKALGQTSGADAVIATAGRASREKGDKDAYQSFLIAAQIEGRAAGAEVKAELQSAVEGTSSLGAFADDETRQMMQAVAMPAAVATGVVAPVLRLAMSNGPLRSAALDALRQSRGEEAAKQLIEALSRATDEAQRLGLITALSETGDFAATPTLVALLDDPVANVHQAAARGLGRIRDPSSSGPVAAHLVRASKEYDFAFPLIIALGTIGKNDALATLEKLAKSEEESWVELRPFLQQAMRRIKTGNPD